MDSADYLRAELHTAAEHEMIVEARRLHAPPLQDRLVVRDGDIVESPGLNEVAEILFGADADGRLADYVSHKAHAPVDNP